MKKVFPLLLVLALALFSNPTLSQQSAYSGDELMVGYYGRPDAKSLGVLGQYSIEELTPLIQAKADEYDQINGNQKVIPAYHLIYGLATGDPGRKKDFLLPLSEAKLMKYINAAEDNGYLVIIDTQLGAQTPLEAITPVLKYLKYSSVHLAVDPEFEVNGLDIPPGRKIGHITGEDVNQVQSAMIDFMNENGISGKKILMVHSFTEGMVTDKDKIKLNDEIDLIMNLDGHGSPALKINVYNTLYTARAASRVSGGFKLFFLEDKPAMMTPAQSLGLESVDGHKLAETPRYINYQ
jgi:hypothetical protein